MPEKLLKKNEIDGLLKKPGKHRDGAGLYLQIARRGQASWVYQFRWNAETKWMSIGPAATFKLEEARKRHHELRRMRDRGIDPRSSVAAVALQPYQPSPSMAPAAPDAPEPPEQPASPLFGEVVELFLNDFAADWAAGKARFDPCNLVPHGVAHHASWVETRISLPLNQISLFAHPGNRLGSHHRRDRLIGIPADHHHWTPRTGLRETVPHEVLTDELIVVPSWLYSFRR